MENTPDVRAHVSSSSLGVHDTKKIVVKSCHLVSSYDTNETKHARISAEETYQGCFDENSLEQSQFLLS